MKLLTKKKYGLSHVMMLSIFLVFMMIMIMIYISYTESRKAVCRTEDAAIVSMVSVALHDRYEYSQGMLYGQEILCYYPGGGNVRYTEDDTINMQITKQACSFAFEYFKSLMLVDMPLQYLNVEIPTADDIAQYTKSFCMTNVRGDTAYIYDIISGEARIVPSTDMVSLIELEMEIKMKLPFFGEKTYHVFKTNKLRNRD